MTTWKEIVQLATSYPGIFEAISYGEPSLKVRKSLVTRWRKEDNSLVLMDVDPHEREQLLSTKPDIYFLEPHYERYETILARLEHIDIDAVEFFVMRRWRNVAPKKLIAQYDEQQNERFAT